MGLSRLRDNDDAELLNLTHRRVHVSAVS